MAGDEDLRLNTLHRFAKHSPRLVLHEYAHCEIPAGCGGVVMRWYDPAEGAPATVRLFVRAAEAAGTWLDGAPLASSLAHVRAGGRVIAVHLRRTEPTAQPFTLGVFYDADDDADLLAGPGPRWACTAAPPPEGWMAPGFDDAPWRDVPRASAAQIAALERWEQAHFAAAAAGGRHALLLETDELWLRVAFTAAAAPTAAAPTPEEAP